MMSNYQDLWRPQDLVLELEDQQGSRCCAVLPKSEINIKSLGVIILYLFFKAQWARKSKKVQFSNDFTI